MHLHSSQPRVQISKHAADTSDDNNNDDDDDDDILEVIERVNPKKRSNATAGLPVTRADTLGSSKGEKNKSNQVVVDLLNDSDSDDEDVEIIDGPMSKKSRPS